jgi:hypothetical protein
MQRPNPYVVLNGNTTPDEPHRGWYFSTENDHGDMDIHGPFSTRMDAEQAIDDAMFNAGEIAA